MKFPLLKAILFTCFLFLLSFTYAQKDTLSLDEASQKAVLKVLKVRGIGGYRGEKLEITLQNSGRKRYVLHIPAGQQFPSKDTTEQDLLHTQDQYLTMSAGNTKMVKLFTMCMQANNMSPGKNSGFSIGSLATGSLLSMAQVIASYNYQSSTAQSAVWAVSNGRPLRNIYAPDTVMARRMATIAAKVTGQSLAGIRFAPRRHQITSFRTSLEAIPKGYVKNGRLVAEDSAGHVGTTYFSGKKIEPGFCHYRVGVNHTRPANTAFWLRLYDGDSLIAERRVTPQDTITPCTHVSTTVKMSFEMTDVQTVSIGLYDAEDRLHFILKERAILTPGMHNNTFQIGKIMQDDIDLWVRVINEEGEVLAQKKVDKSAPMAVLHKVLPKRGHLDFELEEPLEDGKLGVYNEEGELIKYLYTNMKLGPGKKHIPFDFKHREGMDAKLFLKLIDGEGNVVHEEKVP